jgi:hypothetical protein
VEAGRADGTERTDKDESTTIGMSTAGGGSVITKGETGAKGNNEQGVGAEAEARPETGTGAAEMTETVTTEMTAGERRGGMTATARTVAGISDQSSKSQLEIMTNNPPAPPQHQPFARTLRFHGHASPASHAKQPSK